MTTGRDLINDALEDAGVLGVGQTATAEDMNKGLRRLNAMLAQWARRRWLVYHLVDVVFQADGGLSYSIGSGGDIAYARPDKIESAFFRQIVGVPGNQVDYPLEILNSREDYNRIALKAMQSFPQYLFYDSGFPLGNIFIWPVPTDLYEIHLSIKTPLQSFTSLNDVFDMPPEYEEAIRLNLALTLLIPYQIAPNSLLVQKAKVALNTLKNANAQIQSLQMPRDLAVGNTNYNIWADTGGGT